VAQGELQLLDVADPRIVARGSDAGVQVGFDKREAIALCGVDLQETATHASVFMGATGSVWTNAVTQFDPPTAEMFTELIEFLGGGFAVTIWLHRRGR
jgi:hypothetical protein